MGVWVYLFSEVQWAGDTTSAVERVPGFHEGHGSISSTEKASEQTGNHPHPERRPYCESLKGTILRAQLIASLPDLPSPPLLFLLDVSVCAIQ